MDQAALEVRAWLRLFLAAAALDSLTMLLLPPGGEANPIVVHAPLLALGLKWSLAAAVVGLSLVRPSPWGRVAEVGAFAWTIGALTNLLTVLWHP